MKVRVLVIAAVVLAVSAGVVRAANRWGIGNPIGPATLPPSSYSSSGVVGSAGGSDARGDVGDGNYLGGVVPYRGATSVQGQAGLRPLDSFLRRSAGSQGFGSSVSEYSPYSPLGARTGGARFRPRAISPQELERLLAEGVGAQSQAKGILREQNLGQMEQVRRELEELASRSPRLRESLTQREDQLKLSSKGEAVGLPEHFVSPSLPEIKGLRTTAESKGLTGHERADETSTAERGAEPAELETEGQLDIYDQIQQEIEKLQKKIEDLRAKQQTKEDGSEKKEGDEEKEEKLLPVRRATGSGLGAELEESLRKSRDSVLDVPDTVAKAREALLEDAESLLGTPRQERTGAGSIFERPTTISERPAKLAGDDVSEQARSILGRYESFESYTKDKYNRCIVAAEVYMRQGRYYRAADSYAMASVYKPGDPLGYIGKSHALFAAGEYMSSALFLSRALEVAPGLARYSKSPDAVPAEYVGFKVGLTAMIEDRDKLESRAVDVEQWLKTSGAPELQLLLGHVYYQMGRSQRAKEAIDAAYQKMPDSAAVQALKKVIE